MITFLSLQHEGNLNTKCNSSVFQGKVEMELELLTKDEESVRPAGKARDEPNMNPVLEEPKYVKFKLHFQNFF